MLTYEELQFTTADIPTDLIPKVIAKVIEEREPRLYFRQLCTEDRRLMKQDGLDVHYPIETEDTFSAWELTEGEDITAKGAQELKFTSKKITCSYFGTFVQISQEVVDTGVIDYVQRHLRKCARVLARLEDERIMKEFLGWTEKTDTFTGDGTTTDFTLTNTLVLKFLEVTVAGTATTAYKADYYKGKIRFDTAPGSGASISVKYAYSNLGTTYVSNAQTVSEFGIADIRSARTKIVSRKYEPGVAIMHPETYAWLLKETALIYAEHFGAREPIYNGEVGQVFGLRVISTTVMPEGVLLYLEPRTPVVFAIKKEVFMEKETIPKKRMTNYYFYSCSGQGLVCKDALQISTNHQANAISM